ncbi:hypothetical protein F4806DRAFT_120328 [Annulohypoxylon nitens]|nr:hypothetical protein F4806DRAFT_120328 [Annulohypoxylon nitens]
MVRIARRSHKKSRAGCSECKGRHIKCDEGRPACGNCTISSRACSFLASQPPHIPTVSEGSASSSSPSSSTTTITRNLDASPSPRQCSPVIPSQEHPFLNIEVANMMHMELFYNFIHGDLFDLPPPCADPEKTLTPAMIVEIALPYPFLMNEILAFSALHLSFIRPLKAQLYRHHAIGLQTQALTIFNGEMINVDRDNCMAVLIFSWLLTLHTLVETVESAESADMLDPFVHCMRLHLGVRAIKTEAWHMMLESKMGFMLESVNSMLEYTEPGSHTAELRDCIRDSKALSDEEKATCMSALDNIQWFLSSIEGKENEGASLVTAFLSLISWPGKIDVEFHQLVAKRSPEALVILSYFAVPLHLCRDKWIVRNAGQLLFQSVRIHLPDEWHRWLNAPEEIMKRISAGA